MTNGRIAAVGPTGAVRALAGASHVDLTGKTVMPAIVNAQIRARANEVFMNSLPCYLTFQMTKDAVNNSGHSRRM